MCCEACGVGGACAVVRGRLEKGARAEKQKQTHGAVVVESRDHRSARAAVHAARLRVAHTQARHAARPRHVGEGAHEVTRNYDSREPAVYAQQNAANGRVRVQGKNYNGQGDVRDADQRGRDLNHTQRTRATADGRGHCTGRRGNEKTVRGGGSFEFRISPARSRRWIRVVV